MILRIGKLLARAVREGAAQDLGPVRSHDELHEHIQRVARRMGARSGGQIMVRSVC